MINGSINARRKIFIKEMINGGYVSLEGMMAAYKKAFPTCKKEQSARVGGYKLLQVPAILKAIDKGINEKEALIKKANDEEIQRQAKEQIVTQSQIEAVLSQIVMGKRKRKKVIAAIDVKSGKLIKGEVEEEPSERDIVSASDKLLRIKGAYAPLNVKHEAGDSFIEALKEISKRKNNAKEAKS